jgi:methylmalonyl-CoA mutase N-terminal domain/subunit
MEQRIFALIDEIDALGGMIAATESGWVQRQIGDTAYDVMRRKARGEKISVGVNKYVDEDETKIEIHRVDPSVEKRQVERLARVKRERDEAKIKRLLAQLQTIARDERANIMPVTIDLAHEYVTMGEIVEALKDVWGTYREEIL